MRGDFSSNYFNNREFESLISRYEQMLKKDRKYYFDVGDFEQIVEYYMDMDQNVKALKALKYAFKLHPNAFHLMIKKAQIHLKNKNPQRALNSLEAVENIESSNTEIYLTKGHSYLLMGNLLESQDYFDKAISIVEDRDEMLDILQNIAQTLQFSDYFKEAIRYLLKAYDLDKENLMVIYDLAYCYDKSGKTDESILYYNRYLNVEPYSEHIWYSLGNLYTKTGDTDNAIEAYEMAIAINPQYVDSIYELAVLLEDNYQFKKAIRYYNEYLSNEPDSADIYLYIGNCYFQLNATELALENYRKSLSLEAHNPEVYYAISALLHKQKHYWDALFYAKRATHLDESDARFHVLCGKINSHLKMFRESAKSFLKAVELNPEMLYHWLLLTDELIRQNKYERALKYLLDSREYHGNNAVVLFRVAAMYYKIDKVKYSLQYFKKAMLMDQKRNKEFFNICPEAKRSNEIKKVMKNKTI
jgi:tetratricopeptide (TPR) repeat protein